jgi:hypothetical protein
MAYLSFTQSNTNNLSFGSSVSLSGQTHSHAEQAISPEPWFFYWKTSASLWESKLREMTHAHRVIIPVNWSFHSDTGERFDFGDVRPETDLARLAQILEQTGKNGTFLLPLTPSPFIASGGIPHLLARVPSVDHTGKAKVLLGAQDELIKIHSFYDSRVFQGYSKFVTRLGQYFSEHGISNDVYGCRYGFFQEGRYCNLFEDFSPAYEAAFRRYLEAKMRLKEGGGVLQDNYDHREQEHSYDEFSSSIQDVYLKIAKENLFENWEGELDVSVLGSSHQDLIERITSKDSSFNYLRNMFLSSTSGRLPSICTLSDVLHDGILKDAVAPFWKESYLNHVLSSDEDRGDEATSFHPLSFFKVCETDERYGVNGPAWSELNLWDSIQGKFGWCFQTCSVDSLNLAEEDVEEHRVLFVSGKTVDDRCFHQILRYFLGGGKVLLNKSGLEAQFLRRLETFILENSLQVEKVHFQTSVHNTILGEGRLIVFEGDELVPLDSDKKELFWSKLIATFDITHPEMSSSEGLESFWFTRTPSPSELNYEEVRRISFFNPSSYKKSVKITLPKNFAFLRLAHERHVELSSKSNEIEIQFLPGAYACLDFGVFHG